MELGGRITIPDMGKLDPKMAMKLLHFESGAIQEEILSRIEDRTPVLTGALKEDEAAKPGSGSLLVTWYLGSGYQDAEWHRAYGAYQEGGALGLSTYTNGPHEMFARVAYDDLPIIEEWATRVIQEGMNAAVGEANASAETVVF